MDRDKPIPKEFWDWYLAPPINYRKVYGDPLPLTPEEKLLLWKSKTILEQSKQNA